MWIFSPIFHRGDRSEDRGRPSTRGRDAISFEMGEVFGKYTIVSRCVGFESRPIFDLRGRKKDEHHSFSISSIGRIQHYLSYSSIFRLSKNLSASTFWSERTNNLHLSSYRSKEQITVLASSLFGSLSTNSHYVLALSSHKVLIHSPIFLIKDRFEDLNRPSTPFSVALRCIQYA